MVTQSGQISYSQPFLQPIPKQRSQPATLHFTLCLEEILIHSNLLNLITSPTDFPEWTRTSSAEFETSDEELPESNDPYVEVPKNDDEWIE